MLRSKALRALAPLDSYASFKLTTILIPFLPSVKGITMFSNESDWFLYTFSITGKTLCWITFDFLSYASLADKYNLFV